MHTIMSTVLHVLYDGKFGGKITVIQSNIPSIINDLLLSGQQMLRKSGRVYSEVHCVLFGKNNSVR